MLKLNNGKYLHLDKAKEYTIWRILQGEQEGDMAQQDFVRRIDSVWLDYTDPDCPVSYKEQRAHLHIFSEQGTGEYAKAMGMRK